MHIEMWWLWMILAAILLIGEIFTAGFFLLWFSIGAAGAGVLALLGIGPSAQLIVFILSSGILFVFGRRFAERVTAKQPPGIGADRFVGLMGVVLEEIDNIANTGKIRIGSDIWRAGGENGDVMPVDSIVKVLRIEGTRAIVQKLEKECK
jgi:inner membrane protein